MSIHKKSRVRGLMSGNICIQVIHHCARCGGTHEHVTFQKFTEPIEFGGIVYAYWTMCPTLNEPIIMARKSEQDSDDTP